jgi:hypothetical protein
VTWSKNLPFRESGRRPGALNRQTAQDERAGCIAQHLGARLPFHPDHLNRFGLTHALFRDQELGMAPLYDLARSLH